jgi:vitamin B12 transporter
VRGSIKKLPTLPEGPRANPSPQPSPRQKCGARACAPRENGAGVRWVAILIVVSPLLCPAAIARADEISPTEPKLGTVVVTATRTQVPLESVTQSVSVVSGEDIANQQANAVVDALRNVPGVDVSQTGSAGTTASVFIRGADADQSLILIDGVEVNSPTLGGFNFGNIMTDDVGRIEVLRGAGGTLYGSQAIGGVINILSRKGEGAPRFSVSSGGGNIGTSSTLAESAGERGIVAYSTSLGYLTTAGYQPVNDDFSNLTTAGRLDVTPSARGTLRGYWRVANSSLGLANNNIGNGYGDFLDPNAREHDQLYLGKIEWEHAPLDTLTYRVSAAYVRTVNKFQDTIDPGVLTSPNYYGPAYFLSSFRVPNDAVTAQTQLNYAYGTMGVSTVGFEFQEQKGALKSVMGDGSVDEFSQSRSNYAGYVQQQLHLFDQRLTAVGGFRVDGYQGFGAEVSSAWSVGYLEDWGSGGRWETHVKGGYSEGFRAPTFNELYYPKSGNQNLDAETSSEYDGGVAQHLGVTWLATEATYFTRRTSNLIQFAPLDQCPGADVPPGVFFTGCNIGRVDVQGVETAVTVGPLGGVSLRGSYTYLDWNVLGGQALLRRPHNRMATTINYDRDDTVQPGDRLNANVLVVFVGERTDIDPLTFDPNASNPSFTRVDLALRYDMPWPSHPRYRVGTFARVQNLFDQTYDEVLGFRSPPINVLAGARVAF